MTRLNQIFSFTDHFVQGKEVCFYFPYSYDLSCCPCFLAHLSQRLIGELIVYPWSGVLHHRPSTISNVFYSETAWPIKAKFYVEPPWEGRTKVCINGTGNMI